MPKLKTKFIAQVTTKLGKTPIVINVPVDFSTAKGSKFDDVESTITEGAVEQLHAFLDGATLKLKNKADLKRGYKAVAKASASA